METWFTADLHLGHGNIIKYSNRPFMNPDEQLRANLEPRGTWQLSKETIEYHDTMLLEAINSRVKIGDTLWILGDFCMRDVAKAKAYRARIRCKNVNLVWGNHDSHSVATEFSRVVDQGMVSVAGQKIWLNHYPMRSWDGSFHGSWHLYGHVHGRLQAEDAAKPYTLTRDVGVDACDYKPISFAELQDWMQPRVKVFNQRKAQFIAGETVDFIE